MALLNAIVMLDASFANVSILVVFGMTLRLTALEVEFVKFRSPSYTVVIE